MDNVSILVTVEWYYVYDRGFCITIDMLVWTTWSDELELGLSAFELVMGRNWIKKAFDVMFVMASGSFSSVLDMLEMERCKNLTEECSRLISGHCKWSTL